MMPKKTDAKLISQCDLYGNYEHNNNKTNFWKMKWKLSYFKEMFMEQCQTASAVSWISLELNYFS